MKPLHHALVVAAGFCVGLGASGLAMATTYKVKPIDIFGSSEGVVPLAMNANGDVTGYYLVGPNRDAMAFAYVDGVATAIGPAKKNYQSWGVAINKKGQVALQASISTFDYAYLYAKGRRHELQGLDGRDAGGNEPEITVVGLANDGTMVGNTWSSQVNARAWKQVGGVVTPLMAGTGFNQVYGLNNKGQMVGWLKQEDGIYRSFLQDGSGLTILPGLPGEDYSNAYAVSETGHVIGQSTMHTPSFHYQTYLYRDGVTTALDVLGTSSWPSAINSSDQVVGYARMSDGQYRGFIWENGSTKDLNTLLDPVTGAGWTIVGTAGINDKGVILGQAEDATGVLHAVLLKPME